MTVRAQGTPSKSSTHCYSPQLTKLIHGIDISMAGNELFHHALHRQAGCQDQCRGAICHAGIQVCGAVPDENLEEKACRREGHGINRGTRSIPKSPEFPNPHSP